MFKISYFAMVAFITLLWILVRLVVCRKHGFQLNRELKLILVYICLIVVARFTFFPFAKVNGKIQPLVFDASRIFPIRLNLIPIVYLFDYEIRREALINVIGNTAMFMPIGVIWPLVFRNLNTHKKAIAAGVGLSLFIEILQLPFFDRVSDIDDLLLNSLGFITGYGIYLLAKFIKKKI